MLTIIKKKELEDLKEQIIELNRGLNRKRDIRTLIDEITKNGIEWYDYYKLPVEQQRTYYRQAQDAINNTAIINEMNKLINELAQWSLKQAPDFKGIEAMRYQVSGMKLLMERLEMIPNPDAKKESTDNPYDVI
jgi:Tfp pilus assembly protein PilO